MRALVLAATCILLASLALPTSLALPASYESPQSQPQAELVMEAGEDDYSVIEIAADGTLYVAETAGPLYRLDPGASEPVVVYDPPVVRGYEWGFVGLALAPDYDTTGDFYAVYMTGPPGTEPNAPDASGTTRVVRVHDGEETLIYEYPATRFHNSGRIIIHNDSIFLSRGEQNIRMQAQDPENPAGKILRMTLDGQPLADNPLGEYGYAMGFRNPFGLAWDEDRDWLVEAEVGNSEDEEVNIILPGGNYGWPHCEGPCDPPREGFTSPAVLYPQVITPTGLVVIGKDYYHGAFNVPRIHRVYETEEGWTSEVVYEHPAHYPIIDVERSPDGKWIYFGTADGLWRIPTPEVSVASMADAKGPEDRLGENSGTPTPITPDGNGTPTPTSPDESSNPTPDGIDAGETARSTPGPGLVSVLVALVAGGAWTRRVRRG